VYSSVVVAGVFTSKFPVPALRRHMHTPGVVPHTLGRKELCKRAAKEEQKIAGVKVIKTKGLRFSDGTATTHSSQADTFASQLAVNFRPKINLNKKACAEPSSLRYGWETAGVFSALDRMEMLYRLSLR
jgi:hypothetical protein